MNTDRTADIAAAFSIPAWIAVKWAEVAPVLQGVLLVLAIVSTGLAIVVHLKKLREK